MPVAPNTAATLSGKRLILGVTGGIAAYKSAEFVRRLRESGADVRVVMTAGATAFVTPLSFQALSGHPVHTRLLDTETESAMGHIELARWADAIVVAPASADFLARLCHGRADDLLAALCLAAEVPVAVAPAMNQAMWANPATQDNLALLTRRNIALFGPGEGGQACGETGPGRLLEPDALVMRTAGLFEHGALSGVHVLITAGPTREALDPVRYLSNASSGRMGHALAQAALEAGAAVTLITGPTALIPPDRARVIPVTTALDMHTAVMREMAQSEGSPDMYIGVAAVADYRPAAPASGKIKKNADALTLELTRNPDILAEVARTAVTRNPRPMIIGFAAETHDLLANARRKLVAKGADLIIANAVGGPGSGFDTETNHLWLVDRTGTHELLPDTKTRLARHLITEIATRYHAQHTTQDSRSARRQ